VDIVAEKVTAAGNLHDRCNVTNPLSLTRVKCTSFFTDLADSWLSSVVL
jgi:hypothetical protein